MGISLSHVGFNLYFPGDQFKSSHVGTFSWVLTNECPPLSSASLCFLGHVNINGLRFSSLFVGTDLVWQQVLFRACKSNTFCSVLPFLPS